MNVIADAVLELGGHVTGVIPNALVSKEVAHRGLSELRVVSSMHERKALMASCRMASLLCPPGSAPWRSFSKCSVGLSLAFTTNPAACERVGILRSFD